MISYLEGKIFLKTEKFVILNVGGVGYKIFLSKKSLNKITKKGEKLKIFCFLNVRENSLELYGFLDFKELEFFEILNNISGVGPKAALEISSLGPLEKIKERILTQDEKIFEGIPGIGRKKAMTIILELSGKIKKFSEKKDSSSEDNDVESALISLGFSKKAVKEAIKKLPKNLKTSEEKIREALKLLGK